MRDAIIIAIATFGLVGCVVFVIAYHRRSDGEWRHNEIGIWLMLSRLVLGTIFALIIARQIIGDWWWRQDALILLVGMFALQTFWPSKFIWSPHIHGIQPRGDARHEEEETHDPRT